MRTNGRRGTEGWIMAIPLVALLVVLTRSGGVESTLSDVESTLRGAVTSLVEFVGRLL
jgi:hypothetical protein